MQYAVDENAPHPLAYALGMQHVIFMLSGVAFIPVLLSKVDM